MALIIFGFAEFRLWDALLALCGSSTKHQACQATTTTTTKRLTLKTVTFYVICTLGQRGTFFFSIVPKPTVKMRLYRAYTVRDE